MNVLVDSSVWIAFFRGESDPSSVLDTLLAEDRVLTNELILCELVPPLRLRGHKKVIQLLSEIRKIPLQINWRQIEDRQTLCLQNGINGIGIPDLVIAQNAIDAKIPLYSLDKHFRLIASCLPLQCYKD